MPLDLTPLSADRFDDWLEATRARLVTLRQESGMFVGEDAGSHVDAVLGDLLSAGHETETSLILTIDEEGTRIGTVWLAANSGVLIIVDLAFAIDPTARQLDELLDELRSLARRQHVGRLSIALHSSDIAGRAFVEGRGFEVASIQMLLEPLPSRASGGLVVTPMTPERFTSFAAASEAAFAEDLVSSGRYSAEDAVVESHRQMELELPEGIDSEGQELFTAHVDGAEVGVPVSYTHLTLPTKA